MAPLLRIADLHKSFGAKRVLDGVDLDVGVGESVVVIGGSGTGKSVLLKCILGILQPDRGQPANSTTFDPASGGLPLGGMAPGAFRTVTLSFPGTVAGRGAAASLALTLGYGGDQTTNSRIRTRLP